MSERLDQYDDRLPKGLTAVTAIVLVALRVALPGSSHLPSLDLPRLSSASPGPATPVVSLPQGLLRNTNDVGHYNVSPPPPPAPEQIRPNLSAMHSAIGPHAVSFE